jgi:hypothetical protein
MAKLMENKQMIHIASEIVVIIGLTFYFNQKNKKLMSHIEDLSQRIEEQEDLLQKHEQVIRKMVDFINQYQSEPNIQSKYVPPQQENIKSKKTKPNIAKPVLSKPEPNIVKPVLSKPEPNIAKPVLSKSEPNIAKPEPKVTFNEVVKAHQHKNPPPQEDDDEDEDDEEESDLDAELEEELKELVNSEDVEIITPDKGLKKRSR